MSFAPWWGGVSELVVPEGLQAKMRPSTGQARFRNVRRFFMSEPTGPILVVDDEPDIRLLVAINLRKAGYRVLEAERGDEALRLAKEQSPALIVLDLMLPDLSGREVCRRLREQPETKATPVLMLTARDEEIEALKQAKAILSGAKFEAFLQSA